MASIGDVLQTARNGRGTSIEDAAGLTRISQRYLEALEANDFEEIPAPVYVRGFLRSYARFLGIDVQPLLDALSDDGYEVPETRRTSLVDGWAIDGDVDLPGGAGFGQGDRDEDSADWNPEDVEQDGVSRGNRRVVAARPPTIPAAAPGPAAAAEGDVWKEEPIRARWSPGGMLPEANRGLTIAVAVAVTVVVGFAIFIAAFGGSI